MRNALMPFAARAALSATWLYQGLVLKVFGETARHTQIVGAVVPNAALARTLTISLGLLEAGLGVWVLSKFAPRACAAVQTALLLAMNAGGLLFARDLIPDPTAMLLQNFAFLVLAWWLVAEGETQHAYAR